MTQFLIRCFIKRPDDVKDAAVRTAYGNLASLVGMACNILLCIGKLQRGTLVWLHRHVADALNNLSDARPMWSASLASGWRPRPRTRSIHGPRPVRVFGGLMVSVTISVIRPRC